jgi:hypothetical protein
MCREAKEIQELRRDKEQIEGGDWFYDCDTKKSFPVVDGGYRYGEKLWLFDYQTGWQCESSINFLSNNYIFIIRQDQLQEMIDFSPSLGGLFDLDQFYRYQCHGLGYSMDQLWLAFVMDKKFGKRWSGESWIEASK